MISSVSVFARDEIHAKLLVEQVHGYGLEFKRVDWSDELLATIVVGREATINVHVSSELYDAVSQV